MLKKFDYDETTDGNEIIKLMVNYTDAKTSELWRCLPEYKKDGDKYTQFKKEIKELYPFTEYDERGSIAEFQEIMRKYRGIGRRDLSDLLALQRDLLVIKQKLTKDPQIMSNKEMVEGLASCLDNAFRDQIFDYLRTIQAMNKIAGKNPGGGAAGSRPEPRPDDLYPLEEVMETAITLSKAAVGSGRSRTSGSPYESQTYSDWKKDQGTSSSHAIKKENFESDLEHQIAFMKDQLVLQSKKIEGLQTEILQTLKASAGNPGGATAIFGYSARPYSGPGQSNQSAGWTPRSGGGERSGKCFYCELEGHMKNDCPHRQEHLQKKLIVLVDGRVKMADGGPFPRDIHGSMKDRVEGHYVRNGRAAMLSDIDEDAAPFRDMGGMGAMDHGMASAFMRAIPQIHPNYNAQSIPPNSVVSYHYAGHPQSMMQAPMQQYLQQGPAPPGMIYTPYGVNNIQAYQLETRGMKNKIEMEENESGKD